VKKLLSSAVGCRSLKERSWLDGGGQSESSTAHHRREHGADASRLPALLARLRKEYNAAAESVGT
jgi:hypothetical protein